MINGFLFWSLALILALPIAARAADHSNLDEGLPISIDDPYPLAYRDRDIQLLSRYERLKNNEDRLVLEPRLEYGLARNTQLTVFAPFFLGSADQKRSGDIGLEALYNIITEPLILPAVSVAANAEFPTGKESEGVDPTAKILLTKTLGHTSYLNRLYLNGLWKYNSERQTDERKDMFEGIAGYGIRLGPDTFLIADYVYRQEIEHGKEVQLAELGVRRQITPLMVIGVGAGAGIGPDSPDFQVTVSIQHALTLFYGKPK